MSIIRVTDLKHRLHADPVTVAGSAFQVDRNRESFVLDDGTGRVMVIVYPMQRVLYDDVLPQRDDEARSVKVAGKVEFGPHGTLIIAEHITAVT